MKYRNLTSNIEGCRQLCVRVNRTADNTNPKKKKDSSKMNGLICRCFDFVKTGQYRQRILAQT